MTEAISAMRALHLNGNRSALALAVTLSLSFTSAHADEHATVPCDAPDPDRQAAVLVPASEPIIQTAPVMSPPAAAPVTISRAKVSASAKGAKTPAPASDAAKLAGLAPELSDAAIREALAAIKCAKAKGIAPEADRLAIVDYTRPSLEPRLWIFDLAQKKVLFEEFVAHGKNSGFDVPTEFSNATGSYQTSLGLFVTDETYEGGNGYSLKLLGLSGSLNDGALQRKIVMHGADYVNPEMARTIGRLGRSLGCPAVRREVARPIIDTLKDGQFLYAYGPGSAAAQKCDSIVEVASAAAPAKRNTNR
jgi:hypothetical protein